MRTSIESNRVSAFIARDQPPALPELRELRYFRSVARKGNFGRAALELNISQPSISHKVQKLEDQLGRQLLIRHGRGVTLTAAGSSLLQRLDVIMHLLALPLEDAHAETGTDRPLTCGVVPELAPVLVPRLIERTRAQWPDIPFTVVEAVSARLEEQLMSKRIDLAVLQDPPTVDQFSSEPVLSEALGLVASVRSGQVRQQGPIPLRQLAELPLVLPDPMHWIHRKVESAGFQRGIRLQAVLQADSVALAKEAVRKGIGYAVLPYMTVREEISHGMLSFIPIVKPELTVVHAVCWNKASGAHAGRFAAALRMLMTALVDDQLWPGATSVATPHVAMAAE